ncbi:hypothetical protein [Streptomyces sp. NPDC059979]|uniref:hypothetical protein n=1 Tax=Streptomyces sp. NPDC059979 TaxID=3347021 RepID=UPI0036956617
MTSGLRQLTSGLRQLTSGLRQLTSGLRPPVEAARPSHRRRVRGAAGGGPPRPAFLDPSASLTTESARCPPPART